MKTLVIRAAATATGNFPRIGYHSLQINQGANPDKTITIFIRGSSTAGFTAELKGCVDIKSGADMNTVNVPSGFAYTEMKIRVDEPIAYIYVPEAASWSFRQDWTTTSGMPEINYSTPFRNINEARDMFKNAREFNQDFTIISDKLVGAASVLSGAVSFRSRFIIPFENITSLNGSFSNTGYNELITNCRPLSSSLAFENNKVYNKPVGGFDMSANLSMTSMFAGATSFNQRVDMWTFNKEVDLVNFMGNKSSSDYFASYYDSFLIKLAATDFSGRAKPKVLGMGTIKYSASGVAARASLVSSGWTITDGGQTS